MGLRQHTAVSVAVRCLSGLIKRRLMAGLVPSGLSALARLVHQLAVLGTQVVRDEQEVQRRHHMPHADQQHEAHPGGKRPRSTPPRGAGCPRKPRGAGCPRNKSTPGARCPHASSGLLLGPARHGSDLTGLVEAGQARAPGCTKRNWLPQADPAGAKVSSRCVSSVLGVVVGLVRLGGVALARVLLLGGGRSLLRVVLGWARRRRGRLHGRACARLHGSVCRGRRLGECQAGHGEHETGSEGAKGLLDHE